MSLWTELWVPCELWTINHERRMHHQERARRVRDVRTAAFYIARDAINRGQFIFDQPVVVAFQPLQAKGVLADVVAHAGPSKAVLDGLVDAKLIPGDDPHWVLGHTYLPPLRRPVTGIWVTVAVASEDMPTLPERRIVG